MNREKEISFNNPIPWVEIFHQAYENPGLLRDSLSHLNFDPATLLKLSIQSTTSTEAYGRKILYKDSNIEVMLARWSFQAMAQPHNHGHSKGLIWFVMGNFFEQQFLFKNRELKPKADPNPYFENQVVRVGEDDIHSCCPQTTGLSLHLYVPPIKEMRVWDQLNKKTLVVADNCGAWIPSDSNLIIKEIPW